MSISSVEQTSASAAAGAAILQAQAAQYASHFSALQNAVNSGSLSEAQRALSVFLKDSAVATYNGYDPVNHTPALRTEFQNLRRALSAGDMQSAKDSMYSLQQDLAPTSGGASALQSDLETLKSAVQAGDLKGASTALRTLGKDVAEASASSNRPINSSNALLEDVRTLQAAIQSGSTLKTSSSFIKMEPQLSYFAQSPLVFPTASAPTFDFSVNTINQAILQSLNPTTIGQSEFPPSVEMLLGSRGITI